MESLVVRSVEAASAIFVEASIYLLFGTFVAGLIAVMLPQEAITRHLGGGGMKGVAKAALFGIPLPLCSCGVIPTALSLRRQGGEPGLYPRLPHRDTRDRCRLGSHHLRSARSHLHPF